MIRCVRILHRIVTSLFTLGKRLNSQAGGASGPQVCEHGRNTCITALGVTLARRSTLGSWREPRLQPPVELGDSEEETTERLEKVEAHISPPRRSGYERAQEATFWLQENKLCQGEVKLPQTQLLWYSFKSPFKDLHAGGR